MTTTTVRQRTCRTCGGTFLGGPRAWYCPACRAERQRQQAAAYKARRRAGKSRPLGSLDICCRCGAAYTVYGGNQRYCPDCAPGALFEADRSQGLAYYRANRERINPTRNERRRKPERVCAICGAAYMALGKSNFCSAECREKDARQRAALAEAKRKEKRMKLDTSSHGGKRPGAGRPKGAADKAPRKRGEPSETRQVTMRAEVWAMADARMAATGMTRKEFFEKAVASCELNP